jgi:flagellar basal-body rod protein FlgB
LPLFDITHVALERALHGASMRQRALTENLANANVPGYQRRDVDFQGALQRAMARGIDSVERTTFTIQTTGAGAMQVDGTTVDIDQEAAELARNSLLYEALTAVLKGRDSILRTAIGGRH